MRILARTRLLPLVGDVLVRDHIVVGVGQPVRTGRLQVDVDVRDGRLVVLMGLEPRVELVAGRGEVRDADDLARRTRRVVALAPVDRGAMTFQQRSRSSGYQVVSGLLRAWR